MRCWVAAMACTNLHRVARTEPRSFLYLHQGPFRQGIEGGVGMGEEGGRSRTHFDGIELHPPEVASKLDLAEVL